MKKLISLALALAFVLSMATVAMAADVTNGNSGDASASDNTVTIKKTYTKTGDTAVSPAETFSFTIESGSVTNGGVVDGEIITTSPAATISKVTYDQGDAGSANATKDITVTLPSYSAVGVYSYTIQETAGNTAGVTYRSDDIVLKVTVVQGEDGKLVYGGVHCEVPVSNDKSEKTNSFSENNYAAGTLRVSKTVSGNLADQDKAFEITVAFEAPKDEKGAYLTVGAPITTKKGDPQQITIAAADWSEGKVSKTFTLKHDQTVTFENIPYGVTYTVTETLTEDYTQKVTHNGGTQAEGNTATAAIGSGDGRVADATVAFENNKQAEVDTGITLDAVPFIVILAICAGTVVAFAVKKRRTVDF